MSIHVFADNQNKKMSEKLFVIGLLWSGPRVNFHVLKFEVSQPLWTIRQLPVPVGRRKAEPAVTLSLIVVRIKGLLISSKFRICPGIGLRGGSSETAAAMLEWIYAVFPNSCDGIIISEIKYYCLMTVCCLRYFGAIIA